ncbi:MAG: phosphotransferase family protein [Planctomycetota bacterium]|jgi:aminoglycoside phosphotransferase (APT) family kinase protein
MRFVANLDKIKRLLSGLPAFENWRIRARKSSLQVQRYKPERRLILRADLGLKDDRSGQVKSSSIFIRLFTDGRGEAIQRCLSALRIRGLSDALPEPLGCVWGGRLYAESALRGSGIETVEAGQADAGALASIIAQLHREDAVPLPLSSNESVLEQACSAGAGLVAFLPECREQVRKLLASMREKLPLDSPRALLHGDLHMHQVLWSGTGPKLVDFERASIGHPLHDLGNALAHLQTRALADPAQAAALMDFAEDLEAAYFRERPELNSKSLVFFLLNGLMQRALLPARRLQRDWKSRSMAVLEYAQQVLGSTRTPQASRGFFSLSQSESNTAWDRFYPSNRGSWPGRMLTGDGELIYGMFSASDESFRAIPAGGDKALPGLADAMARGELISYRPGRRATLRLSNSAPPSYIKLVRPERVLEQVTRHKLAQDLSAESSPDFPLVPPLLAVTPERGSLVYAELSGRTLHSLLLGSGNVSENELQQLASGLSCLHRTALDRVLKLPKAENRPLDAWLGFIEDQAEDLLPDCRKTLDQLEELVETPVSDSLVHGDLHDRNIIFHQDRVALIDLGSLSRGSAIEDIGNLCAHLILRSLQSGNEGHSADLLVERFVNAYRRAGGSVDRPMLVTASARTLFRLACLYRFRRQQAWLCPMLLGEARRLARQGCRA